MFTFMPPSADAQRMKRSPKDRTSSLVIVNPNALTYQSAVRRGSGSLEMNVIDAVRHAPSSTGSRVSGLLDKSGLRASIGGREADMSSRVRLRSHHRSPIHREQQVAEVRQGRAAAVGRRHGLRLPRAGGARASRARRPRRLRLRVRGAGAREVAAERIGRRYGWRVAPEAVVLLPGVIAGINMAARMLHDAGRRPARAGARLSAHPALPRQHGA